MCTPEPSLPEIAVARSRAQSLPTCCSQRSIHALAKSPRKPLDPRSVELFAAAAVSPPSTESLAVAWPCFEERMEQRATRFPPAEGFTSTPLPFSRALHQMPATFKDLSSAFGSISPISKHRMSSEADCLLSSPGAAAPSNDPAGQTAFPSVRRRMQGLEEESEVDPPSLPKPNKPYRTSSPKIIFRVPPRSKNTPGSESSKTSSNKSFRALTKPGCLTPSSSGSLSEDEMGSLEGQLAAARLSPGERRPLTFGGNTPLDTDEAYFAQHRRRRRVLANGQPSKGMRGDPPYIRMRIE